LPYKQGVSSSSLLAPTGISLSQTHQRSYWAVNPARHRLAAALSLDF
jgi:hypothetical protein